MRFLILGAGGIGCFYGARLIQAGHDCVFVARGEHLHAMRQNGLQIRHPNFSFHAPVLATDIQSLPREHSPEQFDLILLTLKAGATCSVLAQLKEWLATSDTPILSLQNGVDNEPSIAKMLGDRRTFGGLAVRIGGHILEPGIIEATGPAQVIFGPWPNSKQTATSLPLARSIETCFNAAAIPTQLSSDIRRELWRKLLINNGVNPLSALTGLDTRRLTSDPTLGNSVYRMMQETASVATADDVELSITDVQEMFTLISQFDAIKTSMLVDREKGRALELDGISGAVLRRGQQLNIDTPITALVHRLLELGVGTPDLFTPETLDEHR
ncbi:2-dehydropantoate 2-reductase [Marinobacterium zhoushanense]|uniref:2-dehydropantoate 2-reductase n=1 Tax=Marinobacterium zhoushanense TaxID=1679163 RepID=A0ABQ1KMT5_9GAMM|nr:2-dehydropantoate 2-reductase [Marinobacterium zhoushanense]GGC01190.1 2-dehydropantoate 2-reductase [Marinobacterium zhoushanense]